LRTFPISLSLAGGVFGPAMAFGSAIGLVLGGVISTYWQRWDMRAPVWITMLGVCAIVPLVGVMLTTDAWKVFGICLFLFSITVSTWAGPAGSLILNIVKADMRASAASIYVTIQIAVSMSIGPYATGKISEATGSLGTGIGAMLLLLPLSLLLLWLASRRLDRHSLSVSHNQGERT
jgi:MFS-type transporter involved in bile tolerance (Atg22 family)